MLEVEGEISCLLCNCKISYSEAEDFLYKTHLQIEHGAISCVLEKVIFCTLADVHPHAERVATSIGVQVSLDVEFKCSDTVDLVEPSSKKSQNVNAASLDDLKKNNLKLIKNPDRLIENECLFQCKLCSKDLKLSSRGKHLKRKHGINYTQYISKHGDTTRLKWHSCEVCKEKMSWTQSIISDHIATHNMSLDEYEAKFSNEIVSQKNNSGEVCVVCDKSFMDHSGLEEHKRRVHKLEEKIGCQTSQDSGDRYVKSVEVKLPKLDPKIINEKIQAEVDLENTGDEEEVWNYSSLPLRDLGQCLNTLIEDLFKEPLITGFQSPLRATEEKVFNLPYKCATCGFRAGFRTELISHTEEFHTKIKPFFCCGLVFTTKWNHRLHTQSEHPQQECQNVDPVDRNLFFPEDAVLPAEKFDIDSAVGMLVGDPTKVAGSSETYVDTSDSKGNRGQESEESNVPHSFDDSDDTLNSNLKDAIDGSKSGLHSRKRGITVVYMEGESKIDDLISEKKRFCPTMSADATTCELYVAESKKDHDLRQLSMELTSSCKDSSYNEEKSPVVEQASFEENLQDSVDVEEVSISELETSNEDCYDPMNEQMEAKEYKEWANQCEIRCQHEGCGFQTKVLIDFRMHTLSSHSQLFEQYRDTFQPKTKRCSKESQDWTKVINVTCELCSSTVIHSQEKLDSHMQDVHFITGFQYFKLYIKPFLEVKAELQALREKRATSKSKKARKSQILRELSLN